MITKEKLNIYIHFNGDIDGWARMGTADQKLIMKDKDWYIIDGFIQDFNLVKKGRASEGYFKNIIEKLKDCCDNEDTIIELKKIAGFD